MDYTTLTRVKSETIKTSLTTDDALIALLITGASRAIDRKVTGSVSNDAADYFQLKTVNNEEIIGRLDKNGNVICAPRKPIVTAITLMEYRLTPIDNWKPISVTQIDGQFAIGWLQGAVITTSRAVITSLTQVFVRISYTGGLAATVADLPADLIELATLLTTRFYKEAETGLNDAIGVAELGTLIYTKAWPVRFVAMLEPFVRRVGWNRL